MTHELSSLVTNGLSLHDTCHALRMHETKSAMFSLDRAPRPYYSGSFARPNTGTSAARSRNHSRIEVIGVQDRIDLATRLAVKQWTLVGNLSILIGVVFITTSTEV